MSENVDASVEMRLAYHSRQKATPIGSSPVVPNASPSGPITGRQTIRTP